ncbi:MAG: hypothetical protein KDC46_06010 [Thermoleophilia bacterium]|nr:hypothetical protein [Thermoleophilia bacterium]
MKLFRVIAALGAVLLVGRQLTRRLRAQFLGMSHPGGFLTASSVQNGRFARGARGGAGDYTDASRALDASWVDEDSLAARAAGSDAATAAEATSKQGGAAQQ